MYLQEILSLFSSIDSLILEGFKDDMYRLYPEEKENSKFGEAIKVFNSNNKIKEAIKKQVPSGGNLAASIKKQFPIGEDFINLVNDLLSELNEKEKEREEYRNIKQGNFSGSEMDFWLIPCHTFDELHEAAFKYTGNLPRLSNEEITNEYNIKAPKPATKYRTQETPEEFLERMKKEDRFFMTPSWCVAANESYFETYNLHTEKNEKPRCYVIISKRYPNVRFCITLKCTNKRIIRDKKVDNYVIQDGSFNELGEVRDPWQIGDKTDAGLKMIALAFGNTIEKALKNIKSDIIKNSMQISQLEKSDDFIKNIDKSLIESLDKDFPNLIDGTEMFRNTHNLKKITSEFPKLQNGKLMFRDCYALENVQTKLPLLENGNSMFDRCQNLRKFEGDLPNLTNGGYMFNGCEYMSSFASVLPSLSTGEYMFCECRSLSGFLINLPKLVNSDYMFADCKNLISFFSDLTSLKTAMNMFSDCNRLKIFESDFPSLKTGTSMFDGCENLENFKADFPKLNYGTYMFRNCSSLSTFSSNLSSLECGKHMFFGCGELKFRSPLPKLIDGYKMFHECKLDKKGLKIIAESLPSVEEEIYGNRRYSRWLYIIYRS